MNPSFVNHLENSLHHLYISPLEQCNLCCKMCYTSKTPARLTNEQIVDFVHRYNQAVKVETITFCGGEVFLISDFISLVNGFTKQGIFVQIITNGTIDKLAQFSNPNQVNLIVSLDGLPKYHDKNRGPNRWQQSITFLKKAATNGFHIEVFSIITKENLSEIAVFEKQLETELGQPIEITYHPRKPIEYLTAHPLSNKVGETDGFSFISTRERVALEKSHHVFPAANLGCYQISLMSDGNVYGCCEGIHPIGALNSNIDDIINTFKKKIKEQRINLNNNQTLGCIEPDFICGLKQNYSIGNICR